MGRYIIKYRGLYAEWSTVVDAPVSYFMPLDSFEEYYRWMYGEDGMIRLPDRMVRVRQKGTSAIHEESAYSTMLCNRAGPEETDLLPDEIFAAFSLYLPVRGMVDTDKGWKKADSKEGRAWIKDQKMARRYSIKKMEGSPFDLQGDIDFSPIKKREKA